MLEFNQKSSSVVWGWVGVWKKQNNEKTTKNKFIKRFFLILCVKQPSKCQNWKINYKNENISVIKTQIKKNQIHNKKIKIKRVKNTTIQKIKCE